MKGKPADHSAKSSRASSAVKRKTASASTHSRTMTKSGKDKDIPNSTVALLLVLTLVLMLWSSVVFIQNIKLINAAPYSNTSSNPNSSGGATLTLQGKQVHSSSASAGFTLTSVPNGSSNNSG